MDIKTLLEKMNSMMSAEKKSSGPKFPGYWNGANSPEQAKDKMVGGSSEQQESVFKELNTTAKETKIKRNLEEAFKQFKGVEDPEFQDMVARLGQRAKQGPLKTVWDPVKRVYKNVPIGQSKKVSEQDQPAVTEPNNSATTTQNKNTTAVPYTGADAEKFAKLSPQDQSWYTKGGSKPDLNDPYIAARAPNKGKPVAPAPVAKTTTAPVTPPTPVTPPAPAPTTPVTSPAPAPTTQSKTVGFGPNTLTSNELAAINKISDPNKIYVGQKLQVPGIGTYTVQRGDTLSDIATAQFRGDPNASSTSSAQQVTTPAVGTTVTKPAQNANVAPAGQKAITPVAGGQPPRYKTPQEYDAEIARFSKTSNPALAPNARYIATLRAEKAAVERGDTQGPIKSNLGITDQGLSRVFGNLEKKADGNWYFPGGYKVRDPRLIRAAEKSISTPQDQSTGQKATTNVPSSKPAAGNAGQKATTNVSPASDNSSFADLVGDAETGNKNIPNRTGSSAAGIYGFMPSAFKGYASLAKPGDPLYGKTWNDYLTDLNVQKAAMKAAEDDYNNRLASSNIEPSVGNKYLMHFLGGPTAIPVMKALEKNPDTPLSKWFGQDPYPDLAIADTPAAFDRFRQSNPEHPVSRLDYNQYRSSRPAIYRQNPQLSRENIRTVGDISNWSNRKMRDAAATAAKRQGLQESLLDDFENFVHTFEAAPQATTPDAQTTNPNAQATNPNAQITQRADDEEDNQAMDSKRDVAVAASTVGGLKSVLGPQIDQAVAGAAMNKMTTGQSMTPQEQQAISSIVPLMAKAAQEPSTAGALRSALQRAGTLAKQGK